MKISDLRIGNLVLVNNPQYYPEIKGKILRVVGMNEKCGFDGQLRYGVQLNSLIERENIIVPMYSQFLEFIAPIILTEEIIMQLFSVYEYGNRKEFRCNPPKERQVENHYQSRYIGKGDDAYLELSPSYGHTFMGKTPVKNTVPEYWFCWYHSANGEWFLPIQDLEQLKYVHQLQNLFYSLTGIELTY